jgi:hypothetical protein
MPRGFFIQKRLVMIEQMTIAKAESSIVVIVRPWV